MKLRLLVFILLFTAVYLQAQQHTATNLKKDSLYLKFSADSIQIYTNKPIIPYIAIDFRNAYTNDHFLSFVGPQVGATFYNKHTIALGFYFLNKFSPFQSDKYRNFVFEKINYVTLIYQFKIFDSKRFDLLAPAEAGYGRYKAEDESVGSGTFVESSIIPLALGLRFDILPHKWIGFKVGVGYRYIYELDSKIGLDGLYFSIGIKLDLRHIYQDYSFYRLKQNYKQKRMSL